MNLWERGGRMCELFTNWINFRYAIVVKLVREVELEIVIKKEVQSGNFFLLSESTPSAFSCKENQSIVSLQWKARGS